jgi:hypothetical protein
MTMNNPSSLGVPMAAAMSDISDQAGNTAMLETVLGNCTTMLPFKFDCHEGDITHSFVMGSTRNGMSVMSELLTNEQLRQGGKPVVIDKGSSMDQLGEQQ